MEADSRGAHLLLNTFTHCFCCQIGQIYLQRNTSPSGIFVLNKRRVYIKINKTYLVVCSRQGNSALLRRQVKGQLQGLFANSRTADSSLVQQ